MAETQPAIARYQPVTGAAEYLVLFERLFGVRAVRARAWAR
ncbi:MAG: hypothetical protein ACYS22_03160 [Planctomycetota bacterium]